MIKFRNTINRYAVYITIIYLGLLFFSPILHNHYNYSTAYHSYSDVVKKGAGDYKTKNVRSAPEHQTILCPACVFEKKNTGSLQLLTPAKVSLFAAIHLPLKDSLTKSSIFTSLRVRAPPAIIS